MAEKKQNKWAGEVLKEDSPFFLSFKEWSDLYEPKGNLKIVALQPPFFPLI